MNANNLVTMIISGRISMIPKPELRGFGGDFLTKPPFKVTNRRELVAICPRVKNEYTVYSFHGPPCIDTLPKTKSLPLKIDGWKMKIPLGMPPFLG